MHAGVPQGAVLSPFLYAIYIDRLHEALREAGAGVRIYGRLVPLLMYADDIVLLARSEAEMGRMHKIVEDYAKEWRFGLNHGKTKMVGTGSAGVQADKQSARTKKWMLMPGKLNW